MSVSQKNLVAELVKAANDVHNAAKVRSSSAVMLVELRRTILR